VNNAIARVAALVAIAAVGALVSDRFAASLSGELGARAERPPVAAAVEQARKQPLGTVAARGVPPAVRAEVERAAREASVDAFRVGMAVAGGLVALGGVLGLAGIRNPRRRVDARDCPGGQLAGVPREGARHSPCDWSRQAA
jgi:hypothetical protein